MIQEELFEKDRIEKLRQKIKELDREISIALKSKNFAHAKALTIQQSQLLQELVELGGTLSSE